ncbi:hypothetical protein [Sphingosinicella microcystinivorans]|jgi:hypothetical protein|uniref:Uncharacterized protein n=1 Tax=Sphingosinicella microcystinivorans TaxID=335406 RepID=A0AAD1D4V1_SPHMI|nr:hypothetical protein [Sphingosinicella microcystinivorans]RKS90916.1 hypothetical protein DFR51_0460 [Sphingosinicella microcystinivorans]BBE33833.1 hypothetical protein SmB9_14910 [Sphingosinicella microcystinivorans]
MLTEEPTPVYRTETLGTTTFRTNIAALEPVTPPAPKVPNAPRTTSHNPIPGLSPVFVTYHEPLPDED